MAKDKNNQLLFKHEHGIALLFTFINAVLTIVANNPLLYILTTWELFLFFLYERKFFNKKGLIHTVVLWMLGLESLIFIFLIGSAAFMLLTGKTHLK